MAKRERATVERKFYLDSKLGTVEVTVKGPAGAVKLSSTEMAISITTSDVPSVIFAATPGTFDGQQPVGANKQLSADGEKILEDLRKQTIEQHKKQQETAGDKQRALLERIGAPDLIEELQVLATPDA